MGNAQHAEQTCSEPFYMEDLQGNRLAERPYSSFSGWNYSFQKNSSDNSSAQRFRWCKYYDEEEKKPDLTKDPVKDMYLMNVDSYGRIKGMVYRSEAITVPTKDFLFWEYTTSCSNATKEKFTTRHERDEYYTVWNGDTEKSYLGYTSNPFTGTVDAAFNTGDDPRYWKFVPAPVVTKKMHLLSSCSEPFTMEDLDMYSLAESYTWGVFQQGGYYNHSFGRNANNHSYKKTAQQFRWCKYSDEEWCAENKAACEYSEAKNIGHLRSGKVTSMYLMNVEPESGSIKGVVYRSSKDDVMYWKDLSDGSISDKIQIESKGEGHFVLSNGHYGRSKYYLGYVGGDKGTGKAGFSKDDDPRYWKFKPVSTKQKPAEKTETNILLDDSEHQTDKTQD